MSYSTLNSKTGGIIETRTYRDWWGGVPTDSFDGSACRASVMNDCGRVALSMRASAATCRVKLAYRSRQGVLHCTAHSLESGYGK